VFCFKSVTERAGRQDGLRGSELNLALGLTKCLRLGVSGVKQTVSLQMGGDINRQRKSTGCVTEKLEEEK
jgi:hypothetical protein